MSCLMRSRGNSAGRPAGNQLETQSQWTTFLLAAVPKQSPASGSHHLQSGISGPIWLRSMVSSSAQFESLENGLSQT